MTDELFGLIKKNIKNPKMYALLLAVFLLFVLIFPYIDSNVLYFKRVDSRLEILDKASGIDKERIYEDPVLYAEYQDILNEISYSSENSMNHIFSKETKDTMIMLKFVSGGMIFWLLGLLCLVLPNIESAFVRFLGFLLFIIVGIVAGFVAKSIYDIFSPWVNIFLFPLIIFVIIILLAASNKKQDINK